jgi:hypothetical protein
MAFTRTVGQLVELGQRRADKQTDDHVDTEDWKGFLSELYGEMHAAAVDVGARYFETEATITATGASSYSLPSDHLATVGVDYEDSAGNRQPLVELMVQERWAFGGVTGQARLFAFTGTSIVLYPTPSSGSYKHLYTPQPTDYSSAADSTSVDLLNTHGLSFVVWGMAALAMHKGDDNQQRAMFERDAAKERFIEAAVKRALTMPRRRQVNAVDLFLDEGSGVLPGDRRWYP